MITMLVESKSENKKEFTVTTNINNADKIYTYEEALNVAGTGMYCTCVFIACSFCLVGMGFDNFGFSIINTASHCDLDMTLQQQGITASVPFLGIIVAAYPWGYYSDTQGRRKTLILSSTCGFLCAFASSMSPVWQFMAVCKFFSCAFTSAGSSATFTLLGESCPEIVRGKYLLLLFSVLIGTQILYNGIAYFILDMNFLLPIPVIGINFTPWRLYAICLALPLLFGSVMLWFLHESPKFLASIGRKEESLKVLEDMYKKNGGLGSFPVKVVQTDEPENCSNKSNGGVSFFKSILNQTVPLFKRPLLKNTLLLFGLNFILYGTNNSFVMWFPMIINRFFQFHGSNSAGAGSLCYFLRQHEDTLSLSVDNSSSVDADICIDKVADETILAGILVSLLFLVLNIIIAQFSTKKRLVTLMVLTLSTLSGIASVLTPEPFSSISFFVVFISPSLVMALTTAYFVELFPTSYRGMVACLGILVARISSFIGTNLLGAVIIDHCEAAFYGWSAFVFVGVVLAWFLPSDNKKTVAVE